MNHLFPLPIHGVGTADIESMPSYLTRLASMHGLSVRQLLQWLLHWSAGHEKEIGCAAIHYRNISLASLARPNDTADRLVRVLSFATGMPEIRSTTLLALLGPFKRALKLSHASFRWCPACIAEMEKAMDFGYFKLIWCVGDMKYCHIHNTLLIHACPNCGYKQREFARRATLTRCAHCNKSLGRSPRQSEFVSSRHRICGDIVHMIEQIASEPSLTYASNGIADILRTMDREADTNIVARNTFNALYPTYRHFLRSSSRPARFLDARAFAAIAGIRLHDVLLGRCIGSTRTIDYRWGLAVRNEWQKERRTRRNVETVKAALLEQLKDRRRVRSLRDIAKSVDVSVGYLRYRFPGTAARITKRFQDARALKTAADKAKARRAAVRFFTDGSISLSSKSRKGALRHLRSSTKLAKHVLRREIHEVHKILHPSLDRFSERTNEHVSRST